MCLGIPGQVVEVLDDLPDLAKVDVGGARRAINIGLLEHETVQPGDWVLIHVGYALSKIDEDEAKAVLEILEGIGGADADELKAPGGSSVSVQPVASTRVSDEKPHRAVDTGMARG